MQRIFKKKIMNFIFWNYKIGFCGFRNKFLLGIIYFYDGLENSENLRMACLNFLYYIWKQVNE